VAEWLEQHDGAITRLSVVEVSSAVSRSHRSGLFDAAEQNELLETLTELVEGLFILELDEPVVTEAQHLLRRHPLRAGDAVQLASAQVLASELEEPPHFVSFDDRLNLAAAKEGFRLVVV
jgi:predicted nucleic acid-binding protein